MFRVCLTLLAYIISFLSHSNEVQDVSDAETGGMSKDQRSAWVAPDTLVMHERKKNVNLGFKVKSDAE